MPSFSSRFPSESRPRMTSVVPRARRAKARRSGPSRWLPSCRGSRSDHHLAQRPLVRPDLQHTVLRTQLIAAILPRSRYSPLPRPATVMAVAPIATAAAHPSFAAAQPPRPWLARHCIDPTDTAGGAVPDSPPPLICVWGDTCSVIAITQGRQSVNEQPRRSRRSQQHAQHQSRSIRRTRSMD